MAHDKEMISIVIPHAGVLDPLKVCLERLMESVLIVETDSKEVKGASVDFEVIVVTDKPESATLQFLEKQKNTQVITNSKFVGTEVALNTGLKAAKGQYLMYLMSDVEISLGALDIMAETLESHPEFGWVALSSEHTGFLAGCSMFTQEAFEKVGYWDEDFESGGGFSDDDYLRRMWNAGYKPHIIEGYRVHHREETVTHSLLGDKEKLERFKRNQQRFNKRWGELSTDWGKGWKDA